MSLKLLANKLHESAVAKGWYENSQDEDAFVERMCNNLHDEISELHEAWRNGKLREPCDKAKKMFDAGLPVLSCLEEELADIIIRTLDNAAYLSVNIDRAVETKDAYNHHRAYRHGGKKS